MGEEMQPSPLYLIRLPVSTVPIQRMACFETPMYKPIL